jgi:hypothetical protein
MKMQLLADARATAARGRKQRNYRIGLMNIADALIASGYTSLDQQAKALGLSRSTAWTIIHAKHKVDRLSTKVSARMLENPELPPLVRTTLQKYLAERSAVAARPRRMAPIARSLTSNPAADSG